MGKTIQVECLRIPAQMLIGVEHGLEIKNLAYFHDWIMDEYFLPTDTHWATVLRIKYPDLDTFVIDINSSN